MVARRRNAVCFAAALSMLGAVTVPSAAQAQDLGSMVQAVEDARQGNALFNTIEVRSDSLKGLQQWTRVIGAMRTQGPAFNSCAADAANCTTSALKKWRSVVTAASKLPYEERTKAVNRFFNGWPYRLDSEIYGVREYWATPKEFMTNSGDCEDYSIAKYYALRSLGYSKDELRIVALRDQIRGFGHAVLVVYVGSDILVLDNLSEIVVSHTRYKHYLPQVSMNETTRWAHVGGPEPRSTPSISPSSPLSADTLFRRRGD